MLIYLLQPVTITNQEYPKIPRTKSLLDIHNQKLSVIHSTSIKHFGIPISDFEIDYYNKSYSAWMDFLESKEEVCLVIDKFQNFINNLDNLYIDPLDIEDNELIFPYYPFQNEGRAFDITYSYGHKLDTSAYYINKNTAITLVNNKQIERCLDEHFIYQSNNNNIIINSLPDKMKIAFDKDSLEDRNRLKLKTILSIDLWTSETKTAVFEGLDYIFQIGRDLSIPMFLSDGSLLGLIRHGNIMGWDDDMDITVDLLEIENLILKIRRDNIYEITQHIWLGSTIYYKIWRKNGIEIPGYTHRFPFIDIWTYTQKDTEIGFTHMESVDADILLPLKAVAFNHVNINIPNKPLEYLDILFSDWRTTIQVYSWSHQTETNSNLPLQASIKTDDNGRILVDRNVITDITI